MSKPKISVVMPVYNTKEEFLREAILSILSQTYEDFEFLIVDDFSHEYIKNIITSYKDKRIKYFRLQKNSGAATARNYAIDRATGEYIAFLDSDDIAAKDRFEKQVAFLVNNPEIGCLATAVTAIGDDTKYANFIVYKTHFEIESNLIFNGCVFCQSSVMLRKSIIDKNKIRYKDEYVPAEDYGFWLDMIGYTKFAILPEKLTTYRYHLGNISRTQRDIQRKKNSLAQVRAFQKYCNIKIKDISLWSKYFTGQPFTKAELDELQNCLEPVVESLLNKGYSKDNLMYFFKKKFKKHFYKTRSIKGQWYLLNSKLCKFFGLSLRWRIFCFITRGIL